MTDTTKPVEPVALKPCPFCGGQPKMIRPMGNRLYRDTPPFYGPSKYRISCEATGCAGMTGVFDTADEATTAWNTRPALDAANAEIERLTKERSALVQAAKDVGVSLRLALARAEKAEADRDAKDAEIERLTKERDEARSDIDRALANAQASADLMVRMDESRLAAEAESGALVAAAYRAAVNAVDVTWPRDNMHRNAIRALTPADATAALEAYGAAKVREGWEAGMKKAVEIAKDHTPAKHTIALAAHVTGSAISSAILAAIKENQP